MQPIDDKVEEQFKGSVYESLLETPTSGLTPVHGTSALPGLPNHFLKPTGPHFTVFRFNAKALLITAGAVSVIAVATFGIINSSSPKSSLPSSQYAVGSLPVNDLQLNQDLTVGKLNQLTINGVLQANNTIILSPTAAPDSPTAGQIYYDEVTNAPYFYNGTKFVSLNPSTGTTLNGTSGAISLGQGLTLAAGQLNVSNTYTSGLVTSISGTANQIIASATKGNITLSLPQNINNTASPTFGGLTVNGSQSVNGVLSVIGNSLLNGELQVNGSAVFKNQTDSSTAFQIQNAASSSILSVNSINGRIGINTTTPSAALEIHASSSASLLDINGSFSSSTSNSAELVTNGSFTAGFPNGSDLITNGSFTGNADNWTLGSDISYSSNHVIANYAGGDPSLTTSFETVEGNRYTVSFTVSDSNATVSAWLDNNPSPFLDGPYSDGSYTRTFTATSTGTETIHFSDNDYNLGDTWTLDNVSVIKKTGPNNWTLGNNVSYNGNNVTSEYDGYNDPSLSTTFSTVAGKSYKVIFTVSGSNAPVNGTLDNNPSPFNHAPYSDGTYSEIFTATTTGVDTVHFTDNDGAPGDIWTLDNVSIKQITSPTNWTLGSDITYNGNNVVSLFDGVGDPTLSTTFDTVAGNDYTVGFTVSGSNSPMLPTLDYNTSPFSDGPYSDGTYSKTFTATYTGSETIHFSDNDYNPGDTWTLDNVTIGELDKQSPVLKVIGQDGNTWLSLGGGYQLGNTAIGSAALQSNTVGYNNTAFGDHALNSNVDGFNNLAIGSHALQSNTSGAGNIALGVSALINNVSGSGNLAIGETALYSNIDGVDNLAIGNSALYANTSGVNNTAVGSLSLQANTTGLLNTAVGDNTLNSNTTGDENTATGAYALYKNTSGFSNTAIGSSSLQENTTGWNNTSTGFVSLQSNTTGSFNSSTGAYALYSNTTGGENSAVGYQALYFNTTGALNVAVGGDALKSNVDGVANVALGNYAGFSLSSGLNNTFLGYNSGENLTSGTNNLSLGANAQFASATADNQLQIGAGISGDLALGTLAIKTVGGNTTSAFQVQNSAGTSILNVDTTNSNFSVSGSANFKNNEDSISAFQVQNSAGTSILNVDTTNSNFSVSGSANFKNNEDSISAFQIQRSDAVSLISADTLDYKVGIGTTASTALLEVNGSADVSAHIVSSLDTISYGALLYHFSIAGNYAYLFGNSGVLKVIDISDPNNLSQIGSLGLGGWGTTITVSGNYAYTVASGQIAISDISDPTAPSLVSYHGTPTNNDAHISVDGDYLYYTSPDVNNLEIFDISNPAAIVSISNTATDSWPYSTVLSGHYVYIVNSVSNDFQIFDVSNPVAPALVGTGYTNSAPTAVAVSGNFAYVTNIGSNTMQIFDISDPASPVLASTIGTGIIPRDITIDGTYAYVANYGSGNVQKFDISNPAAPTLELTIPVALPNQASINNQNMYVAEYNPGVFHSFNLDTTPKSLYVVGESAFKTSNDSVRAFQVQNSAGTSILNVDTTNDLLIVNGSILTPELDTAFAATLNIGDTNATSINLGNTISNIATTINGTAIFKTTTGNDSTTAFQVQNSAGTSILTVDTSKNAALVSGTLTVTGYDSSTWLSLGSDVNGNTALGQATMNNNTTGLSDTAVGALALKNNTTGSWNTAIGRSSLELNTTGTQNTAIGYDSLQSNTTGNSNTANGFGSLVLNTSGFQNTANGANSLTNNTTGGNNTAIGFYSLRDNTSGNDNTATGVDSLLYNTTGSLNTANGYNALFFNTSGSFNTAFGSYALEHNTTGGDNNTALGASAGNGITTGDNNLLLGYNAGSSLTTGSNNIGIGQNVSFASNTADNQLQIGASISGDLALGTLKLKSATNSATAFVIQNTSAETLFTADTSGMVITIAGTDANYATLTLTDAHFKSTQTTAPTIGTPANCGVTPTAVVTAGSTDTAGSFTITAGTGVPAACDTVFTFNKAYGAAPKSVVISPTLTVGGATDWVNAPISAISNNSFTVSPGALADSTVLSYYYFVVE